MRMQFIVVIITPFYIFCQFYDYQIFVKLDLPKTKKKTITYICCYQIKDNCIKFLSSNYSRSNMLFVVETLSIKISK